MVIKEKQINSKAFTLIEVLIALAIFGVIAVGLSQISSLWISKGKQSIMSADSLQAISLSLYKIKNELSLCKQFNSPSLRVTSNKITFVHGDRIVSYRYVKKPNSITGKLIREKGLETKPILSVIHDVKFFRLDNQLLQISIELENKALTTRIYLRSLN